MHFLIWNFERKWSMQDAEFLIIRMEGTFTTFPSPIEFDMLCLQIFRAIYEKIYCIIETLIYAFIYILMKLYHTLKTWKFSDKKFGVFPI